MTDHKITVTAVHVEGEKPYAARCSCGLRWKVPNWCVVVEDYGNGSWYESGEVEARETFDMWKDLHPTVAPPQPRRSRPEVVARINQQLTAADDYDAIVGLAMVVVAFAATPLERQRAAKLAKEGWQHGISNRA